MKSLPLFSSSQLEQAQGLSKTATETVVASVLDLPTSLLRQWRLEGTGPEYTTTVNGQAVYSRQAVLAFVHRHMRRPTQKPDAR